MKLAITLHDQDFASTKSIGIYNASLGLTRALAALRERGPLTILSNQTLGRTAEAPTDAPLVDYVLLDRPHPKRFQRVLWDQWQVTHVLNALEPDWAFFPKGFPPGLSWPRCKVCCYIHDTISDFYRGHPENPFSLFERYYFPWLMHRAFRKADLIVTNSQFSRSEILKHRPAAKVEVLGIGFDDTAPQTTVTGVIPDYPSHGIVLLASALPHKLTLQALQWLARWDTEVENRLPIIVVGGLPASASLPERDHWQHIQRLPSAKFKQLLAQSRLLLYFSAYEGYGMPPIEALRAGTAALASDLPPHREHLPSELLFSNKDYSHYHAAMQQLLSQPLPPVPPQLPTVTEIARRLLHLLKNAS